MHEFKEQIEPEPPVKPLEANEEIKKLKAEILKLRYLIVILVAFLALTFTIIMYLL